MAFLEIGVLIIGLCIAVFISGKRRHDLFKRLGIPGPKPARFLGIIPMMKQTGVAKTDLQLIKEYGRIVGIFVGHRPSILTTDPDLIKEVCVKRFNNFQNRASIMNLGCPLQSSVALAKGERWKFLRSKLAPIFSVAKLEKSAIIPIIDDSIQEMLNCLNNKISTDPTVDVYQISACYSMDVLCSSLFGQSVSSHISPDSEVVQKTLRAFNAGNKGIVKPLTLCSIFPWLSHWFNLRKFNAIPEDVRRYFSDLVSNEIQRRQKSDQRKEDLLQFMLEAEDNCNYKFSEDRVSKGELSLTDITANCLFFVLSGYETVANAISLTLLCLAVHSSCKDRVITEIQTTCGRSSSSKLKLPEWENVKKLEYLDRCVNECLRLFPPFLRFNRTADVDTVINGTTIPKGLDVSVSVFALHRDKDVWTEPETYDPDRFDKERFTQRQENSFLPFGVGPRECFPKTFAIMEIKMAVVAILQNFAVSALPDTEFPPVLEKGSFSKAEKGVLLSVSSAKS